ncbi:MAG: DUF6455 family protein [Rhodobacteraceae bacterium]|nr:DUF6455 family protein [Paracoccaceae bacterium]
MTGLLGLFDRARRRILTPQELDRLCADLAVTREDIATFANARPGVRNQMEAMAAHFGVTGKVIDATRWRALEIVWACTTCEKTKECKAFLAGHEGEFDPYDCPNAAQYAELSS